LVLDVWGWGEGEEEWVVDEGAEEEEEVSVGGERGRGEGLGSCGLRMELFVVRYSTARTSVILPLQISI